MYIHGLTSLFTQWDKNGWYSHSHLGTVLLWGKGEVRQLKESNFGENYNIW